MQANLHSADLAQQAQQHTDCVSCRVSVDSSKEVGEEASSSEPGSLQRQLDMARAMLAARDASARKYKVRSHHCAHLHGGGAMSVTGGCYGKALPHQ